jgi:hypothetical protein
MKSMMEEFERLGQKEDFDDVVEGMTKQLLSKDIMYEPMKQICDRYPDWLAANRDKLSSDEYEMYVKTRCSLPRVFCEGLVRRASVLMLAGVGASSSCFSASSTRTRRSRITSR